jgi:hypothetical protein
LLSGAGPEVLGRVHTHFPTVPILTKPMHRTTLTLMMGDIYDKCSLQ